MGLRPSRIVLMDRYSQFKHILEYFVAHLEWIQNGDTSGIGYAQYIAPLVGKPNFKTSGHGYRGGNIQKGISRWEQFAEGIVCINVQDQFGKKDFTTKKCYLNWRGTGVNVIAHWAAGHLESLEVINYLFWEDPPIWEPGVITKSIKEIELFNGKEEANEDLISFFDAFSNLLKQNTVMAGNQDLINTLYSNYNIILNGAPGTGKTYLAKNIAAQMITGKLYSEDLENNELFKSHCKFVQFHPSYDYTDFVEGLRPKKDVQGNIAFERKDGIFKEFCKNAIQALMNNEVDNFDAAWDALIADIDNKGQLSIPLLSGSRAISIELTVNGDGLAERTYDEMLTDSKEWIRGKSKFFNKEQLYNVYRGLPGVPSGGHDNYRKAIVKEMKETYGLKDYTRGVESNDDNATPFVFIIDEINRGEMSKIFGELFFSIDPGYRGKKGIVSTQYQNLIEPTDTFYSGFYVPKNVYIIGTMNDIDRSVESMDFAMRRRFAFVEILADNNTSMLDDIPEKALVIERMKAINAIITAEEELGTSYHIGGAYFKKADICRNEDKKIDWQLFWNTYINRLISEYTRALQNKSVLLRKMEEAVVAGNVDSDNSAQE